MALGILLLLLAFGAVLVSTGLAHQANEQCSQSAQGPPHPCPIASGLWGWWLLLPLAVAGAYLTMAAAIDFAGQFRRGRPSATVLTRSA
ncbi:MAG: hypothetical protein L3K07_00040 [Thermoplasmata archaeon]|nr:hypothetical protein [Thermoplasmata archaeon]